MLRLFKIKGFAPYIMIVFFNAFTDLGHKIIIQNTIFKHYSGTTQIVLTAIVNGLILLPFILLFTPAGFLSDKYPKNRVIKITSISALIIAVLITLCYFSGWFYTAFFLTFILAVQSALYSPAKFGYIKELTGKENITAANSLVQSTTIGAILLGMFVFSIIFENLLAPGFTSVSNILTSVAPVGFLLILITLAETVLAFKLPDKVKSNNALSFDKSKYVSGRYLQENLSKTRKNEIIWLSIVGLSLCWGINQVVLAVFGSYLKETALITNTVVVQGLLAVGGFGVILGSVFAAKVSKDFIETGIIPLGAIGITATLFMIPSFTAPGPLGGLFLLYGIFSGMFIVPLNSLIQFNTANKDLGTVQAAKNFIQNIVMVLFLTTTILLAVKQVSCTVIFYILTLTALVGTIYTLKKAPQSFIRYLVLSLASRHYRLKVFGLKNIPSTGGTLFLGNHVSWLDWAILQMASPRRIRFVMARHVYERWYLKWFLDFFGVIPISATGSKSALKTIESHLNQGEAVALFPEGHISRNGQMGTFHRGFEIAVRNTSAVIIPFYLNGLWGSLYSYASASYKKRTRNRFTRDVSVAFGSPMHKDTTTAELKQAVGKLSVHSWHKHTNLLSPLQDMWIEIAKKEHKKTCLVDFEGTSLSYSRLLTATILLSSKIKKTFCNEQNIGLLLPTSSGAVIANLSVLMLGKTIVNLNYTSSIDILKQNLKKAEIRTVLTSKKFEKKLTAKGFDMSAVLAGQKVLYLEDIKKEMSTRKSAAAMLVVKTLPAFILKKIYCKKVSLDSTAAILFSSGSEGSPKGIKLSHRNIIGNIKQAASVLDTRGDDVMLNILPMFHAFGLTATSLMPVLEGMTCICYPDPTNAYAIGKLAAKHKATMLCATSTFLRLYIKNKKLHPLMFGSLRMVVSGAEKLQQDVRTAFKEKFALDIYEGYGTTETAPMASVNLPDVLVTDGWFTQQGTKPSTVGLPLPGSTFMVVDPHTFEELPIGQEGLILISGIQLMTGYVNDKERTGQVFLEKDGLCWYKTGDKGRLDEDGYLSIVDRYSRFAKIGGEMISLGAVEEAISEVMGSSDAEFVAVALPDQKKGEKVVLISTGNLDFSALKQKLLDEKVNPLMLPSDVIETEAIPKLGSGKNDFSRARKLALEMSCQ